MLPKARKWPNFHAESSYPLFTLLDLTTNRIPKILPHLHPSPLPHLKGAPPQEAGLASNLRKNENRFSFFGRATYSKRIDKSTHSTPRPPFDKLRVMVSKVEP